MPKNEEVLIYIDLCTGEVFDIDEARAEEKGEIERLTQYALSMVPEADDGLMEYVVTKSFREGRRLECQRA